MFNIPRQEYAVGRSELAIERADGGDGAGQLASPQSAARACG